MAAQRGLFTPVKVGSLELPNRIVMSPMTRIRAGEGCVPSERMVRYYSQRASAGLIITEGTHPRAMGRGYTYPPGLHTEEQAAGWRKVTDAVHAAGGRVFVQLMHAGRVSHSSLRAMSARLVDGRVVGDFFFISAPVSSPRQTDGVAARFDRHGDRPLAGPHDDRLREVHPAAFVHGGRRQQTQALASARVDLEDRATPPGLDSFQVESGG